MSHCVFEVLCTLSAVPLLVCSGYLFVLSVFATKPKRPRSIEGVELPSLRFDVLVPAHNEELGIAETVLSLRNIDYPTDLYRVIVIADNCTDATALTATTAGALVRVRTDSNDRGKGYALAFGFADVLTEGFADAVVVIDADTVVSPNLLRAFAARLSSGAGAVQADYGVRNQLASWRTRLMVIALSLFHVLRSLGRERLGLSAGLRGNGMGFLTTTLRDVPHDAYSLVEDLEYGIKLGQRGIRVHYVYEASVLGEMVAGEKALRSQRDRWERGRLMVARRYGPGLLRACLERWNPVVFDLTLDLLVPPLTSLVFVTFVGCALTLALHQLWGGFLIAVVSWTIAAGFICFYVLRGWALSGVGLRGLLDLAWAPVYVVWKLWLALGSRKSREWVRTSRQGERP